MGRSKGSGIWVNDIHSRLNATQVKEIRQPSSWEDLRKIISACSRVGTSISVAGGRHAMGTQQFGTDSVLVDTRALSRVLAFDHELGQITVEPGIQWPDLMAWLVNLQRGRSRSWGIRQKQTGADRLTIGGSMSVNAHGRGLVFPPFVKDIVSFKIILATGDVVLCSRTENPQLFALAVGGYGLFGIVSEITVQLVERLALRRDVEIIGVSDLAGKFADRICSGYLYGDFQFCCDEQSEAFLNRGVFSCYLPVKEEVDEEGAQRRLSADDWHRLVHLAHTEKARAFQLYADFYASTSGQIYWSDSHQLSYYLDDYHSLVDQKMGAAVPASEMITEIYLPLDRLSDFLDEVRQDFRQHDVNLFYGTIRLIEPDIETFLPWASRRFACIIFNLHTEHSAVGISRSQAAFQRLIDMAIVRGGSYFLTYHRWARLDQVQSCYPRFRKFLEQKIAYDPRQLFQSDWYRHYLKLFHG